MNQSHETIRSELRTRKWVEYMGLGKEIWCKRFDDAPRCKCNAEKPGVQVIVTCHPPFQPEKWNDYGYEIEVVAEKPDGVWTILKVYGIGPELLSVLDAQVKQLLSAWTAITIAALPYQPKDQP